MSSYQHHPRPHVLIPPPPPPQSVLPPGAQPPMNPSPSSRYTPWAFEVTPPPYADEHFAPLNNPWPGEESPETLRHRTLSLINLPSENSRPPSRATGYQQAPSPPIAFPEPQIYRSSSQRVAGHKSSRSESVHDIRLHRDPSFQSITSTSSLYYDDDDTYGSASNEVGNA